MPPAQNQGEFAFDSAPQTPPRGYDRWKQERAAAREALARSLSLPLGHRVEVWLRGNIRLVGLLALREEKLLLDPANTRLELVVDSVPFTPAEIESCVRLDD